MYKSLFGILAYGMVVASTGMLFVLLVYAGWKNHLLHRSFRKAVWAMVALFGSMLLFFVPRLVVVLQVYLTGSLAAQKILAGLWGDIGLIAITFGCLAVFYTFAPAYPEVKKGA